MPRELCNVEAWALVDSAGDFAIGACPQSAREAYEETVQALASCDGFRLVKLTVRVPLPEVVELTGEAPESGDGDLQLVAG